EETQQTSTIYTGSAHGLFRQKRYFACTNTTHRGRHTPPSRQNLLAKPRVRTEVVPGRQFFGVYSGPASARNPGRPAPLCDARRPNPAFPGEQLMAKMKVAQVPKA